jgi:UDP-N-acetyl-D-glucosamine dehydrogenase
MQGATPVLSAAAAALQETAITRLATKTAKVGVIGLGYVGLPLSLLFTEEGFDVTGFDIDAKKVKILDSGNSYICRIPPTEIQLAATRGFKATSDYSHIAALDAVVICVPTPLDEYRQPDLSFITTTVKSIAPHIHAGQLIVLESTTTAREGKPVRVASITRAGRFRKRLFCSVLTGARGPRQ